MTLCDFCCGINEVEKCGLTLQKGSVGSWQHIRAVDLCEHCRDILKRGNRVLLIERLQMGVKRERELRGGRTNE